MQRFEYTTLLHQTSLEMLWVQVLLGTCFFIHTPIFTNVNRGYILGEIHRVSTQILDENACTILSIISNLQQKFKRQSPK